MQSVLQRALGESFRRLHPQLQRQYAIHSGSGLACVGRGVMERIWHGAFYTLPFLYLGSFRRIMFTETGRDVPFTIENYAYVDRFGRETITWVRSFELRRRRSFDEWLIFSERRKRLVVYAGTHQHLAVELDASADEKGALNLRTGAQRIFLPLVGLRFPQLFSGVADVRESFNEAAGYFEIDVHVAHRFWGPIFGYRGRFELEWRECRPEQIPAHARPIREERRE
jgi:hypothetical protein